MSEYVIIDTRTVVGDCALFWGKDRCGYTCDLNQAGRYDEAQAKAIMRNRDTDRAVLASDLTPLARMHVPAYLARSAPSIPLLPGGKIGSR